MKRTSLALAGLAWTLAAGAAPPSYLDAHYRMLSAPDCVDARNIIAELGPVPLNASYLRVQHIGDPGTAELAGEVANVVTWDVGTLSGLSVPAAARASAQRGYRDQPLPDPASAFQLWCNGAGFVLNSGQFSHTQPVVLAGPSVSAARDFDPPLEVFRNATSALTISGSVRAPWVFAEAEPIIEGTAQVSFMYYALDVRSGTRFAHVIALFDNRAPGVNGAGTEGVSADEYTAFAVSPLAEITAEGMPTRYVTRSAISAPMQFRLGWHESRYFRAYVTYEQFRVLLADLRLRAPWMSPDPQDYRITLAGLLGEIFPGTTRDHEVGLAASITDLAIAEAYYDVAQVPVVEFHHAAFGHYFISADAAEIAALDAGVHSGWRRTGLGFAAQSAYTNGASPVCRFYLPPEVGDSHFFSASPAECRDVAARFPSFVAETAAAMYEVLPNLVSGECPAATAPVYRLWNGRADTNHRYTTDANARTAMLMAGWIAEGYGATGVAWCAPGTTAQ